MGQTLRLRFIAAGNSESIGLDTVSGSCSVDAACLTVARAGVAVFDGKIDVTHSDFGCTDIAASLVNRGRSAPEGVSTATGTDHERAL